MSATWATLSQLPTGTDCRELVADPFGNLYKRADYSATDVGGDWIVRKSNDGGATWATDDDFVLSPAHPSSEPYGIAIDPGGAVYVGGRATDDSGGNNSVVRTNAGGSWSTSLVKSQRSGLEGDARGYAVMTADSFGNIFASGYGDPANIHELPAEPALLSATPDPLQPFTQINLSFTTRGDRDVTGFQIFRSANGGAFGAIATLGADVTSFTDFNLSPGTTYAYYIVSLLYPDGSSNPSNILTFTTDSGSI